MFENLISGERLTFFTFDQWGEADVWTFDQWGETGV